MDFPYLLLFLLALPIVAAALILAVSAARRRRRSSSGQHADEPVVHRLQTDTASVQDAEAGPTPGGREAVPARERRAASARRSIRD